MDVICINDNWVPDPEAPGKPCPSIGDKDTVVGIIEMYGNTFYKLERFGPKRGFLTSHFVDVDDEPAEVIEESIEEPEMVTA